MTGFAEELIDESFGASSKRWALMLLAFGVGAVAALWLNGRVRTRPDEAAPSPQEATSDATRDDWTLVGRATTKVESAWRRVTTPPAVMRKLPSHRLFKNGPFGPAPAD